VPLHRNPLIEVQGVERVGFEEFPCLLTVHWSPVPW
jgi:hypothetical protein